MDTTTLTGPQKKVFEYISKHGKVEAELLKARGLDVRAANNLVNARVLTLTNNVYRIRKTDKTPAVESKVQAVKATEATEAAEAPQPEAPSAELAPAELQTFVCDVCGEETPPERGARDDMSDTCDDCWAKATKVDEAAAAKDATVADATAQAPKPAKTPKPAKVEKVINPSGKCLCGCGEELGPKRRFALGHDAKLHSLVLRIHRGKAKREELPTEPATLEYLKTAPWMKDELRQAIGL